MSETNDLITTDQAEQKFGLTRQVWVSLAPVLGGKKDGGRWYIPISEVERIYKAVHENNQSAASSKRETTISSVSIYYFLSLIFFILVIGGPLGFRSELNFIVLQINSGLYFIAAWHVTVLLFWGGFFLIGSFNLLAEFTHSDSARMFWGKLKLWFAYPIVMLTGFLGPVLVFLIAITSNNGQVTGGTIILCLIMFQSLTTYVLVAAAAWQPQIYFDSRVNLYYEWSDIIANMVILIWLLSDNNLENLSMIVRILFLGLLFWEIYESIDDYKEKDWRYQRVVKSVYNTANYEFHGRQRVSALRRAIEKYESMSDLEREQLEAYVSNHTKGKFWQQATNLVRFIIITFFVAFILESPAQELFSRLLDMLGL